MKTHSYKKTWHTRQSRSNSYKTWEHWSFCTFHYFLSPFLMLLPHFCQERSGSPLLDLHLSHRFQKKKCRVVSDFHLFVQQHMQCLTFVPERGKRHMRNNLVLCQLCALTKTKCFWITAVQELKPISEFTLPRLFPWTSTTARLSLWCASLRCQVGRWQTQRGSKQHRLGPVLTNLVSRTSPSVHTKTYARKVQTAMKPHKV